MALQIGSAASKSVAGNIPQNQPGNLPQGAYTDDNDSSPPATPPLPQGAADDAGFLSQLMANHGWFTDGEDFDPSRLHTLKQYAYLKTVPNANGGFDMQLADNNGQPIDRHITWGRDVGQDGNSVEYIRGVSDGFSGHDAMGIVALAAVHGWRTITVQGSDQEKDLLWLAAMLQGLKVEGYAPAPGSPADNAWKNHLAEEQSQNPGQQNNGPAVGPANDSVAGPVIGRAPDQNDADATPDSPDTTADDTTSEASDEQATDSAAKQRLWQTPVATETEDSTPESTPADNAPATDSATAENDNDDTAESDNAATSAPQQQPAASSTSASPAAPSITGSASQKAFPDNGTVTREFVKAANDDRDAETDTSALSPQKALPAAPVRVQSKTAASPA